ncbi:MAG: hypothetical protein R6V40_00450 [Candidatus Moraniibacteriota bacterium]
MPCGIGERRGVVLVEWTLDMNNARLRRVAGKMIIEVSAYIRNVVTPDFLHNLLKICHVTPFHGASFLVKNICCFPA